jgi:hypothetical protein
LELRQDSSPEQKAEPLLTNIPMDVPDVFSPAYLL